MRIMAITISPRLTLSLLLLCSLQKFLVSFSLSSHYPLSRNAYYNYLIPNFYAKTCPMAEQIVKSVVEKVMMKEAQMGAFKLHFHDYFVMVSHIIFVSRLI